MSIIQLNEKDGEEALRKRKLARKIKSLSWDDIGKIATDVIVQLERSNKVIITEPIKREPILPPPPPPTAAEMAAKEKEEKIYFKKASKYANEVESFLRKKYPKENLIKIESMISDCWNNFHHQGGW